MEKFKYICATFLGIIMSSLKLYWPMLLSMSLAVVFDLLTGLIRVKVRGEGLDSKIGKRGFYKKLSLFASFAFGIFLDFFIPYGFGAMGIVLEDKIPFAMIISSYIVINESISICENLYKINPGSIPGFIARMLKVAKDNINNKDDKPQE